MNTTQFAKPTLLALLFAFGLFLTSCQVQEPVEAAADAPEVAAKAVTYGSCGSCPFPSTFTGPISSHLYPGSPWMQALQNCFPEDLSSFGNSCQNSQNTQPETESYYFYLGGGQYSGNSSIALCSFLYQTGSFIYNQRPGNNWYLESVNFMGGGTGNWYLINLTWRKYICKVEHLHALEK